MPAYGALRSKPKGTTHMKQGGPETGSKHNHTTHCARLSTSFLDLLLSLFWAHLLKVDTKLKGSKCMDQTVLDTELHTSTQCLIRTCVDLCWVGTASGPLSANNCHPLIKWVTHGFFGNAPRWVQSVYKVGFGAFSPTFAPKNPPFMHFSTHFGTLTKTPFSPLLGEWKMSSKKALTQP